MIDNQLKSIFYICMCLSLQLLANNAFSQEVCQITYGSELVKPNDKWMSLDSPFIWFSDDEICWYKKYYPILDQPDNGPARNIVFFDANNGIISTSHNSGENTKIFVTDDGGVTWKEQPYIVEDDCQTGLRPYRLFVLDENTVLMTQFSRTNFMLSKDRGVTWSCNSQYSISNANRLDVEIIDENTWYVPTRDGIVKATNQGATLQLMVPGRFKYLERNASGDTFFALGEDGVDDFFYWIENDTWVVDSIKIDEIIPDFIYISCLVVADDVIYIFHANDLYVSVDFGVSWNLVELENAEDFGLKVIKVQNEVYVSRGKFLKLNCENRAPCDLSTIENEVFAYPNPVEYNFSFNSFNFETAHIFTVDGKLIQTKTVLKDLTRRISSIYLGDLNPGIYLLLLVGEDSTITKKVVKI